MLTFKYFNEADYTLPNYEKFVNCNAKRGVVLFIHNNLNARECDVFYQEGFEECVFCSFQGGGRKFLLVVFIEAQIVMIVIMSA